MRITLGATAAAIVVLVAALWLLRENTSTVVSDPAATTVPVLEQDVTVPPVQAAAAEPIPLSALDDAPAGPAPRDPADALGAPGPGRPSRLVLTGRVIDADGQPATGAEVHGIPDEVTLKAVGWTAWGLRSSAVVSWNAGPGDRLLRENLPTAAVDADGRFTLEMWVARLDKVTRRRLDNRPIPELIVVSEGHVPSRHGCPPVSEGEVDVGTLTLSPGAQLTGRCVDQDGNGIAGADVSIPRYKPPYHHPHVAMSGEPLSHRLDDLVDQIKATVAEDDGRFALRSVASGTPVVELRAVGTRYRRLEPSLEAGKVTDLGDIVLDAGATIGGTVLDTAGRPLSAAEVRLSIHDVSDWMASHSVHAELQVVERGSLTHGGGLHGEEEGRYLWTRTDAVGRFELTGADEGHYGVYADAEGFEPKGVPDVPTGTTDLVFRLVRQGRLVLEVVDDLDGSLLPGASVAAQRFGSERSNGPTAWDEWLTVQAREHAPGTFQVEGVCSLRVRVRVATQEHGVQTFDLAGLADGEVTASRTVRMIHSASLRGRIVDEDGEPLGGAAISVGGKEPRPLARVAGPPIVAADDGTFHVESITPGTGWLGATLSGYLRGGLDLDLSAGQEHDLGDVVLSQASEVWGQVTTHAGDPPPWGLVAIAYSEHQDPSGGRSSGYERLDRGQFTFGPLLPGRYTIVVRGSGFGRKQKDLALVVIDTEPGQVTTVEVSLPPKAVLEGRVIHDGQAVPGAKVTFEGEAGSGSADTGDDGTYRMELSLGGSGHVVAVWNGVATTPVRSIDVIVGQSVQADLSFGTRRLEGVVVDLNTGDPIPDAEVRLFVGADRRPRGFSATTTLAVDDQGRFVNEALHDGSWRLTASAPDYLAGEAAEVTISDTPSQEIRLELPRGASLRGTVLTAAGTPTTQPLRVYLFSPESTHYSEDREDTEEDGTYVLTRLPPGTYDVFVTRRLDGHAVDDRERITELSRAHDQVTLEPGQQRSLDLWLKAGQR